MLAEELQVGGANHGAVGEDGENHLFDFGYLLEEVAACKGFAAGKEGKVDAEVGSLLEDGSPLLRCEGAFGRCAGVGGDAVLAGIAAFAVEVAGGGYAGNEERRYLDVLFGQQGCTAALSLGEALLQACHKGGFAGIAEHVEIYLAHDGTDTLGHVIA